MRSPDMKELKGLSNYGFYPEHYLTGALSDDAKAGGFDGRSIRDLKKAFEPLLQELAEDGSKAAREALITGWFKALGFYDHEGQPAGPISFVHKGKEYQIQVERRFPLRTEGEVWIISDQRTGVPVTVNREDNCELFHQESISVGQKGEITTLPWKDVITEIFSSDFCAAEWLIINRGDRVFLLERGKWQEGNEAFLELDTAETFSVNSEELFRMVECLFSVRAFAIDSAEFFHEKIAQNAHKKASEVTKALRDTVRESIELIANAILENHASKPLKNLKGVDLKTKAGRDEAAALIFDESLRYIYRLLFMFFTESQEQKKGALPVQSRPYQMGYSIEKIRDLEGVVFLDRAGSNFIQQSLERTFAIYFGGYNTDRRIEIDSYTGSERVRTDGLGFSFPALGTDLFNQLKTPILSEVHLPDCVMQEVVCKLSLDLDSVF